MSSVLKNEKGMKTRTEAITIAKGRDETKAAAGVHTRAPVAANDWRAPLLAALALLLALALALALM